MRLPWVRRAELEAAAEVAAAAQATNRAYTAAAEHAERRAAELRELLDRAHEDLAAERQRIADLTQQLAELRRDGFSPPLQPVQLEPPKPLPGGVRLAMAELGAVPGTAEYRRMALVARELLAGGSNERDVAERLRRGVEIPL